MPLCVQLPYPIKAGTVTAFGAVLTLWGFSFCASARASCSRATRCRNSRCSWTGAPRLGWIRWAGDRLSLLLCCAAELLGALCFVLGLLTRVAAIVLAFNFAVVISVVLPKPDLNLQELAFFYLLACITLLCTGAGRFSLDRFVIPRLMGLLRKD